MGACSDGASVSSKAEGVACCCSILCEVAAHEARTGLTLGEISRRSTSVAVAHRVSCCPPSCGTPNKPHNSFITKSNRFRSLVRFSSSSICIPHKACQTLLLVSSHVLSTCAAHAQMTHLLHNTILHHFVPRVQPCHILSVHAGITHTETWEVSSGSPVHQATPTSTYVGTILGHTRSRHIWDASSYCACGARALSVGGIGDSSYT